MGILIAEFVTGGGEYLTDTSAEFSETLIREGRAMRDCVALQLAQASDQTIRVFTSKPPPDGFEVAYEPRIDPLFLADATAFWRELENHSSSQEWSILLIAPESDRWLERLTSKVEEWGGKLLSPDSSFVQLCADKTLTVEALARACVPIAATSVTQPKEWVIKPRFGCGSEEVQRVLGKKPPSPIEFPRNSWHAEPWCPGLPASVSCISQGDHRVFLPPFTQSFSSTAPRVYLGGEVLDDSDSIKRAHDLARKAVLGLPPTRGYFGIDILLGDSPEQDVVLEVNPRITTSWVGLAASLGNQLAEVLLNPHAVTSSTLVPRNSKIRFSADGQITRA